jgi:hypothetical protein
MVYENVNTGETFDIDMTDIDSLPENEKTALETVNQRTDAINTDANAGGVKDTIVINTDGQITDGTKTLSKEDSGTFIANLPNTIIEGILDGSLLGQLATKATKVIKVTKEILVLRVLPELLALQEQPELLVLPV